MDVQKCANKWQIAHGSHRCFWKFSSSTRCIFHFFLPLKDSWNHNPKEVAAKKRSCWVYVDICLSCHCKIPWVVTSCCHFRICHLLSLERSHIPLGEDRGKSVTQKCPTARGYVKFLGRPAILSRIPKNKHLQISNSTQTLWRCISPIKHGDFSSLPCEFFGFFWTPQRQLATSCKHRTQSFIHQLQGNVLAATGAWRQANLGFLLDAICLDIVIKLGSSI